MYESENDGIPIKEKTIYDPFKKRLAMKIFVRVEDFIWALPDEQLLSKQKR